MGGSDWIKNGSEIDPKFQWFVWLTNWMGLSFATLLLQFWYCHALGKTNRLNLSTLIQSNMTNIFFTGPAIS